MMQLKTNLTGCKMARQIIIITAIIQVVAFTVLYMGYKQSPKESPKDCPEKLYKQQKQKMRDAVILSRTAQDDPQLVQYLRQYVIDPPSTGLQKHSHKLHLLPQVEAVNKIYKNMRGGFFVDCGAMDGETASNTFKLEVEQGWTGVLIEMDPALYQQVRGKNRRAWGVNGCLSVTPYPVEMRYSEGIHQLGKLLDANQKAKRVATADCFPLYSILLALNRTRVDYFSLDVEGKELKVLKTIPFGKLDIRVLTVEYNHVPGGVIALNKYMTKQGYMQYAKLDKDLSQFMAFTHDLVFVKKGTI